MYNYIYVRYRDYSISPGGPKVWQIEETIAANDDEEFLKRWKSSSGNTGKWFKYQTPQSLTVEGYVSYAVPKS